MDVLHALEYFDHLKLRNTEITLVLTDAQFCHANCVTLWLTSLSKKAILIELSSLQS